MVVELLMEPDPHEPLLKLELLLQWPALLNLPSAYVCVGMGLGFLSVKPVFAPVCSLHHRHGVGFRHPDQPASLRWLNLF